MRASSPVNEDKLGAAIVVHTPDNIAIIHPITSIATSQPFLGDPWVIQRSLF